MDKCPDLKVCLAHGGGYTCFGIGRMNRGWQVRVRRPRQHHAAAQRLPAALLL